MSVKITRCPQCQTSFKVSAEHLSIAAGTVRCGSCLHVFQALDHLVPTEVPTVEAARAATVASTETEPVPPVTRKKLIIGDDTLISDDMEFPDDEDEVAAGAGIDGAHVVAGGINNSLVPDENPSSPRVEVPEGFDIDAITSEADAWQQALAANATDTGSKSEGDDYSDLFDDSLGSEIGWDDDSNAQDLSEVALFGDEAAEIDTSDLKPAQPAGDDADELDAFDSDKLLAELQASVDELSEDTPSTAAHEKAERHHPPLFTPVMDAATADLNVTAAELSSMASKPLIDRIEPLPVEINRFEREPIDWIKPAKYGVGAVLLLLLFCTQYVFFNFDTLAHNLQARPWLAQLCRPGLCQLPALDATRVVKISNLVVRPHPEIANALAVDAILLNTESEPVPVPDLELLFSTLEKLPVASRRFSPAEFLSGELAGQRELPAGRPVHIALTIVHPGADAVNWSLEVKRVKP